MELVFTRKTEQIIISDLSLGKRAKSGSSLGFIGGAILQPATLSSKRSSDWKQKLKPTLGPIQRNSQIHGEDCSFFGWSN
jgi:hypothetical protein